MSEWNKGIMLYDELDADIQLLADAIRAKVKELPTATVKDIWWSFESSALVFTVSYKPADGYIASVHSFEIRIRREFTDEWLVALERELHARRSQMWLRNYKVVLPPLVSAMSQK